MFAKADLDDDGFVTADDFYNMMTHRVYWDSVKWLKFVLSIRINIARKLCKFIKRLLFLYI